VCEGGVQRVPGERRREGQGVAGGAQELRPGWPAPRGRTASRATLLVTAMEEIFGTHRPWLFTPGNS
jgi:hypothetical protein